LRNCSVERLWAPRQAICSTWLRFVSGECVYSNQRRGFWCSERQVREHLRRHAARYVIGYASELGVLHWAIDPDNGWCEKLQPGEDVKVDLVLSPECDPHVERLDCPTCGEVHEPCTRCGAQTRCPADEPGEPFVFCDACDRELEERG